MESKHCEPASTQKELIHSLKFDFSVSHDIFRNRKEYVMENLPSWLAGFLAFVGVVAAIVLPISLLFWQAARDQRATNRKNHR